MNRRFALIQVLVSVVALAAVIWWAAKQDAPEFPTGVDAIAWLGAALALYAIATLMRGERWHWILTITGVRTQRSDCYMLTAVGYMGNNVLPARAGEALKVVLLSGRCDASKRTLLGSVVAERILDLLALAAIFVVVVYGALSSSVLPTDRPLLVGGLGVVLLVAAGIALWVLRRHHVFERARDWLRPLADSPRALLSREGALLLAAHLRVCGPSRRRFTWRSPARSTSTSASPVRSTWSRSPTSSRRCPPLPGRSGPSTPLSRSERAGSGPPARWR